MESGLSKNSFLHQTTIKGLSLNKAEWLKYWILTHRNGAKSTFLSIKG
jgi:hypothetical protein